MDTNLPAILSAWVTVAAAMVPLTACDRSGDPAGTDLVGHYTFDGPDSSAQQGRELRIAKEGRYLLRCRNGVEVSGEWSVNSHLVLSGFPARDSPGCRPSPPASRTGFVVERGQSEIRLWIDIDSGESFLKQQ